MIELYHPPLVGFEKPAIIRPHDPPKKAMPWDFFYAGGNGPRLTYLGAFGITTDGTSFNFGNVTTPRDGLLIVAPHARGTSGAAVSTIVIGGTSVTRYENTMTGSNKAAFGVRALAAGAYNVTVTMANSVARCALDAWLLENYLSEIPHDGGVVYSGDASFVSSIATPAFDIPAGGVALFSALAGSATTTALNWSAATERSDRMVEVRFGAADLEVIAAVTGHVETAALVGSTAPSSIIGASWR